MAVEWVAAALEEAAGFAAYPGTLNLKLDTADARRTWESVRAAAAGIDIAARDAAYCSARCFRVRIEGHWPGAVILPAVNGYPADKLELIAPVRLKDALEIEDGARVTVDFLD